MSVSGKNQGDKYRVKNDCINMVYRKIHGTIIEIFVEEFFDTGLGSLSKKYTFAFVTIKFIIPGVPIFISLSKNLLTINFS